jgi:DNA mismatch repair protein MutS
LTQLADELAAARNFNVGVREVGDQILFLHRLQPGGADRSYGIEVGRLAGLPATVLGRAREVLALLEGEQLARKGGGKTGRVQRAAPAADQLALFGSAAHPVVEALKQLDPDSISPREALALLAKMVEQAREGSG